MLTSANAKYLLSVDIVASIAFVVDKYVLNNSCPFASNVSISETHVQKSDKVSSQTASGLKEAIIKGLTKLAANSCRELLKTQDELEIINNEIVPALDIVGKGFEEKKVYLPQLLVSAEAAREAFDVVKQNLVSKDSEKKAKCSSVLATVKGDIHDIGKNIVKVLLENYGFNVIDLGKDVEPQVVLDAVIRHNAPMVGLSALMTTTVPSMEETIKLLRKNCPNVKTIVGGAVLTKEYADMIGADKYASDAMEAVRFAEEINSKVN